MNPLNLKRVMPPQGAKFFSVTQAMPPSFRSMAFLFSPPT
jgi:hypothetical protein